MKCLAHIEKSRIGDRLVRPGEIIKCITGDEVGGRLTIERELLNSVLIPPCEDEAYG
jgi:hypothetical protein